MLEVVIIALKCRYDKGAGTVFAAGIGSLIGLPG